DGPTLRGQQAQARYGPAWHPHLHADSQAGRGPITMILIALRILFGASLAYAFSKVWQNAQTNPQSGDLVNAFYLALCVILAIANAVVWAPYFGDALSEPLTGVMVRSTYVERPDHLLRLIHWLENRGHRRLTIFLCFLAGDHYPNRPTAFVIGFKYAKPGA